jgi:hypothetical protein
MSQCCTGGDAPRQEKGTSLHRSAVCVSPFGMFFCVDFFCAGGDAARQEEGRQSNVTPFLSVRLQLF